MNGPVRVLIVDDSTFMRSAIARLLAHDPRFEVVGQAKDGAEAIRLCDALRPSVVSMDFNMPGVNGADATREIMQNTPTPIVMLSAHTRDGASATVQALAAGAVDFVTKPAGEVSADLTEIRRELLDKLLVAAGVSVRAASHLEPVAAAPSSRKLKPLPSGLRVLIVAASTGGPAALSRLIPNLDASKSAIIVVQHMPAGFTAALAAELGTVASVPVREAQAGEELAPGRVLIAPGDQHLTFDVRGRVVLSRGEPVHGVRPAADLTFKSAAEQFGPRVIGVVLTGMGRDGAVGLSAVKACGGRTLAQDRASSLVYGMPRAAAELGAVDHVAPLTRIPTLLRSLLS